MSGVADDQLAHFFESCLRLATARSLPAARRTGELTIIQQAPVGGNSPVVTGSAPPVGEYDQRSNFLLSRFTVRR